MIETIFYVLAYLLVGFGSAYFGTKYSPYSYTKLVESKEDFMFFTIIWPFMIVTLFIMFTMRLVAKYNPLNVFKFYRSLK